MALHNKSAAGFTMIELAIIVLLLAVFAAVALPKMFEDGGPSGESAFVTQATHLMGCVHNFSHFRFRNGSLDRLLR